MISDYINFTLPNSAYGAVDLKSLLHMSDDEILVAAVGTRELASW
jgi:hypothetical protein